MATKKAAKKVAKSTANTKKAKPAKASDAGGAPRSMPKGGKDPEGGLTAKGREYFARKEGAHLRPGVQGPADTPEKMVRKGSFLRRHFANPRGPMKDDKGEPTRLALSAHAWGEDVPQNMGDAKTLAAEGHELLEQYHAIKEGQEGPGARQASGVKRAAKTGAKTSSKKAVGKKTAGTKTAGKKTAGTKTARKVAATKTAAKKRAAGRS